jgi:hypothetical protein
MVQRNQLDDFADTQRTASWFIMDVKTGRKPKVFSCGAGTKCDAAPVVKQSFDETGYALRCTLLSQEKLLGIGASRDTIWIGNLDR